MINSGNLELNGGFAEATAIIVDLAEKNITKAADIAGLKAQIDELKKKLEVANKEVTRLTALVPSFVPDIDD